MAYDVIDASSWIISLFFPSGSLETIRSGLLIYCIVEGYISNLDSRRTIWNGNNGEMNPRYTSFDPPNTISSAGFFYLLLRSKASTLDWYYFLEWKSFHSRKRIIMMLWKMNLASWSKRGRKTENISLHILCSVNCPATFSVAVTFCLSYGLTSLVSLVSHGIRVNFGLTMQKFITPSLFFLMNWNKKSIFLFQFIMSAIRWAAWTGLRVPSGWSMEACPNGHIWPEVLGCSKGGKVCTEKELAKIWTFQLQRSETAALATWTPGANKEGFSVEAAIHCQNGCFWAQTIWGMEHLVAPACSIPGHSFWGHCRSTPMVPIWLQPKWTKK